MRFRRKYVVEYKGEKLALKEYCKRVGLKYNTLTSRLLYYKPDQTEGIVFLKHGDSVVKPPEIVDYQQSPDEVIRLLDLAVKKAGSRVKLAFELMVSFETVAKWFSRKNCRPSDKNIQAIKYFLEE